MKFAQKQRGNKMAYQPLYASVKDKNCTKSTTSCRGKIDWIKMDCNTLFGSCIDVRVDYKDGNAVVNKPNLRATPKKDREAVKKAYEQKVDNETKVIISIDTNKSKYFDYYLDGIEITEELKDIMRQLVDIKKLEKVKEVLNQFKIENEV